MVIRESIVVSDQITNYKGTNTSYKYEIEFACFALLPGTLLPVPLADFFMHVG